MGVEKRGRAIRDLESRFDAGVLDLQPWWQRGLVWETRRSSALGITALMGRVVPAIYVWKQDKRVQVLDSKQRVASLLTFLKGDGLDLGWSGAPIALDIEPDEHDPWFQGKTFAYLTEEWRSSFEDYNLSAWR